ncbi:unnamed protein product [Didymodactylos carnosus]|uniref:NAD(P)(+)--arginine ADP-ribosyltransferase n=1 Tax=Didymodactylos carnosus TaxID=1234261 RepID=A0A8S2DN00_9BILA|nr:unnamed protein product [Didymodactylos carnosus]CAF3760149.1 unnamed protein product [Didymodactylos carnosus]
MSLNENVQNLESFTLVWLDENVNNHENLQVQMKLRESINYIKTFQNLKTCKEYIRQIKDEKVVFVVSGSLGRKIVRIVHNLPQLSTIYVYCKNKQYNEKWTKKYKKVKSITTQAEELITTIERDQSRREISHDSTSINIFKRSEQSLSNLQYETGKLLWFQLFIETILEMNQEPTAAKTELVTLCKKVYEGNAIEQHKIEAFNNTYSSTEAVKWYTRDMCLYRILNKALRIKDTDTIFSFRSLIRDIFKQLKEIHQQQNSVMNANSCFRVYRGQALSKQDIELIKDSIGEFLSMNSFLSTSKDRAIALAYAVSSNEDSVPVLFDIIVDSRHETKPFADISALSYFQNEQEVLFMLCSIFRIVHIRQDSLSQIWLISLDLCNEDDSDYNELFSYAYNDTIAKSKILLSLSRLLRQTSVQSQKCFKLPWIEISLDDSNSRQIPNCSYEELVNTINPEQDLDNAQQELQRKLRSVPYNHISLGLDFLHIGVLYGKIFIYDRALSNFGRALEILHRSYGNEDERVGWCYNNIAVIFYNYEEYDSALSSYFKSLDIKLKLSHLPYNHRSIAQTFVNIALVYQALRKYEKALVCFEQALKIKITSFPLTHIALADLYENIGLTHYTMANWNCALTNLTKAASIHDGNSPTVAFVSEQGVKRCCDTKTTRDSF